MRAIILLTLAGLGLAGCSNVFDKHVEYKYVEPNNYPILKAVGYAPISLQQGANKSQKQLMAIKAINRSVTPRQDNLRPAGRKLIDQTIQRAMN